MEYLILSALLYARAVPPCPKPFIKNWQDNRAYALKHLPKRPCRYQTPTGAYTCSKEGCNR